MDFKVVTFKVGDEEYAIDIKNIESVVEMLPITKVPDAPYGVEGVINLRGEVMPIIDGRKKFGSSSFENDKAKIIIVNLSGKKYGFIVDDVREVLDVNENEIEDVKEIMSNLNTKYVDGIIKKGERLIVLLKPNMVNEEIFSVVE
ncbi:MAG: purine-binding chemotaxis protein CheW [Thermotogaceae bacterium]|jgi:purine-binding chemotaxis protein CheW|nr:purine-binding chemotaxis protein CheW [Thermotogaceae bacterium]MDN5337383.1 purine-binding chemotaxis protein CheW [Thermotogaceae bacterium]